MPKNKYFSNLKINYLGPFNSKFQKGEIKEKQALTLKTIILPLLFPNNKPA